MSANKAFFLFLPDDTTPHSTVYTLENTSNNIGHILPLLWLAQLSIYVIMRIEKPKSDGLSVYYFRFASK